MLKKTILRKPKDRNRKDTRVSSRQVQIGEEQHQTEVSTPHTTNPNTEGQNEGTTVVTDMDVSSQEPVPTQTPITRSDQPNIQTLDAPRQQPRRETRLPATYQDYVVNFT